MAAGWLGRENYEYLLCSVPWKMPSMRMVFTGAEDVTSPAPVNRTGWRTRHSHLIGTRRGVPNGCDG